MNSFKRAKGHRDQDWAEPFPIQVSEFKEALDDLDSDSRHGADKNGREILEPSAYSGQSVHSFRLKPSSDSGRSRPAVPGQTVQSPVCELVPSERSDARSSSLLLVLVSRGLGFHLPQRLTFEGEPVGVVDQPVEDGVGHGGVGHRGVPVLDGELA